MNMPTIEAVLFRSSFRVSGVRGGAESPNISHALLPDRSATLCGRTGWITEEGPQAIDSICCLRCMKKLPKITDEYQQPKNAAGGKMSMADEKRQRAADEELLNKG